MLPKAYDPTITEDSIYKTWEESGAFKPESCTEDGESFTISLPPPNATGQLHLGHAVMLALEDIFIRFARMQGKKALWVPGTDHAAIATENVVIKKLKNEGMKDPRKELGREKLVAAIAEFVENSQNVIRSQVRKMGSSCDWTRERYTFDPALNRCVNEVFAKMYADGLIYRGHRIVNWDPKLQTTVSDDELVYVEEKAALFTFQYGPFQIATARPETKFGDKYVVMHPDDERYKQYKHGDTFEAEWINGPVRATVIKDTAIDPEFGTGVMTITPWHDHTDFEIAERHGLEKEQIIGFDGTLLEGAGEFAGMPIEKARPLIVEKLKNKGLLVKVDENYIHNKAVSQRGGGAIEPQIKLQWFIDVKKEVVPWKGQMMSLRQVMHDVVHHGDITIIPDRFEKTYFHWIDNLRDWCISRQIWWGHRVPVYYCTHCKNKEGKPLELTYIGSEPFKIHPLCNHPVEQDTDTLDTWFSSALWTWSTLVDPTITQDYSLSLEEILKNSPDFQKFHPTAVMETGYDILFFWVARMILMTTYATGQIPFKTVYLHGLIRTRDGKKMSKSDPETMIDPLDMIAKYGADALRLSMIVGQSAGADSRLYEEKIAGYRNFINKLWNASRFVLLQCEEQGIDPTTSTLANDEELSLADKALLSRLQQLTKENSESIQNYRLSEAGERMYSFLWDFFCDWYLELSKGKANAKVLIEALRTLLIVIHPYCPFVTEELWKHVAPKTASMLIQEKWPTYNEKLINQQASDEFQVLIETISTIRRLRAENSVEPGKKTTVYLYGKYASLLESERAHIERMGYCDQLIIAERSEKNEQCASAFIDGVEIVLSLKNLVDTEKLKKTYQKEYDEVAKYRASLEAKLSNEAFLSRARPEIVAQEQEKLKIAQEKEEKIKKALEEIDKKEGMGV